ncbi:MAG TPA: 2OG-Fe(II) oxygenase [Gammaproteobacteria bacterium]
MAHQHGQTLPPFRLVATTQGFLSEPEMDELIADHASLVTQGKLAAGDTNPEIRRSQVVFLGTQGKYQWLYERVWEVAQECNRRFFCVDIYGIEGNIQLARYDSSDQGLYGWRTDLADSAPLRKISISIQLSRPEDYEGGDLELLFRSPPQKLEKARGALIAFPSFALHRVTPVTRGTRWSLVAWIQGNRWR